VPCSLNRMVLTADGTPDHWIHGFVNDTHRATAQFTDDFVSSGFCTVGIVQSIGRPTRAALAIQTPFERVGLRLLREKKPDKTPTRATVNSRTSSVGMPPPTPRHPIVHGTYQIFCCQRYWGTVVAHLDTVGSGGVPGAPCFTFRRRRWVLGIQAQVRDFAPVPAAVIDRRRVAFSHAPTFTGGLRSSGTGC